MEDTLRKSISMAAGVTPEEVHLEHPSEKEHGDYATNLALVLAKERKENPRAVAEQIVAALQKSKHEHIDRIEIAGPGFINFYLSRKFFTESIVTILAQGDDWGRNTENAGKKIMVEYTDPNPFKEFHIGHLMPNVIGESLSRLIEFSGAEVKRANYQGDVGLHVAKAIWGKQKYPEKSWGEAYALGATEYDSNETAKKEMHALNKTIYEQTDAKVNALYDAGRKESLENFEKLYRVLGTSFDFYFFESETAPIGKKIIEENLAKGIFEKSDGAVIFRGEQDGLHTRVFLNSEGLPTYEAKEIGLAFLKEERYPTDISISVTGNEIVEYFKVVLSALRRIDVKLAGKIVHIPHGMLRLPSGKMSSRTGDVVTAESLIDEVSKKVEEKTGERVAGKGQETIESIAIGAIKYPILKQGTGSDIIFDFEKSVSFEGDSGPYLQYAATRAHSILEKAGSAGNVKHVPKKVTEIERLLYRFPEIVERATREYEPHYVATFLTELAGAFNSWYAKEKIIDDTPESSYKLALTKAFYQTMKNGLWLLGIKTPERM
ncbi:arginine--tRNA ligase [Candidatus Kaiserbacteria bacterium RIFCSPHIGHO2_01_FULL_49_13]|uniref:Arginine--tRNA ligase n=1 Tax=Candidatus Kaiserbacteria bacterium RIFCSPHIGHO2_01_FULL_49_13 TaxID=1798477 RepID=A0A1F6CDQ3_9BACT|nr:MAG: arginine--tRNA ligase [Candidatus Kaiserbacteria bacterium RIFCSPHIGHO2_01_FULL_49_13]